MNPIVQKHMSDLAELCLRFRVRRLELFGSGSGDRFDATRSDLDFLVEFHPLPSGERADAYFGLKESMETLFGRSVDLVMTRAIRNPYFLEAIKSSRVQLYAA